MFYKCKKEVKILNDCITKWFTNDDFVKECREQYLKDRREYRLTGIGKNSEAERIKS